MKNFMLEYFWGIPWSWNCVALCV